MNVGFVLGRLFRQGRLDYVLLDYVYFELENSFAKLIIEVIVFFSWNEILFLILIIFFYRNEFFESKLGVHLRKNCK